VLGCREHNIPGDVPYLKVAAQAADLARERLDELCGKPDGRLRVGIAWAGNRKHRNDSNRSMRLEQLAPLLETPGARFFSLQQGHAIPQGFPLLPLVAESDRIDMTGALVMELDLVISVDSLIAHLAGAMGCEVWTLLPFAPDWRWMTGREDSPWYPGMRLFRQPRFGDWADVVRRVGVELSSRINRGY
jgi:ADP-heptose:LPS heptosyltransferase